VGGVDAALARYRLLAFEQAERLLRGTPAHLPADPLVRDLYLLAESAAVDRAIPANLPGLAPALAEERAAALRSRPPLGSMTRAEREVERRIRATLSADPGALEIPSSPIESVAWAQREAVRVRASGGEYRGIGLAAAWGTALPRTSDAIATATETSFEERLPLPTSEIVPLPGIERTTREGGGGEDDPQTNEEAEGAAKKAGKGQSTDAVSGGEADDGDAIPDSAGAGAPPESSRPGSAPKSSVGGVAYPEWDWKAHQYLPRGATVREAEPVEGAEAWSLGVLARNAGLVRRLREQFERLRARRSRFYRQPAGDELDLDACVRALVDLRAGHAVDDRLYASVRPARREISILLLVDISGSTDVIVGNIRIIDVEKEALLLTAQALDALGDRYAVITFSGESAASVRVRTIKHFAEHDGPRLRRRIAALRPEGYTRMGAAIRHATALLGAQHTAHKLLLILSDGKPHDSDHYQGRYAVEDSRQAIAEARAEGVHPFCLTVDRKGSAYLTRIFGESGHLVLSHPEYLSKALLDVVRHLIRR
jgi:nitric oxide reductase NorD protein